MKSKKVSFLRGRRMRATRLDNLGRPIYGDSSVVTTKGFVTAGYTTNTEEGEAISVTNAAGEICVSEPATPSFNGFALEIEFCDVDFALFEILTGQEVVLNENGEAVGITESVDVNLSAVNFALEMWLGASTSATPSEGSQGFYGYVLTPFLGGGVISDVTVENAAITFTITGMQTKSNSNWGSGPYDVDLVAGEAAPLYKPLLPNDHRRVQIVEVEPPAIYNGSMPLMNPDDEPLTEVTATITDMTADLTVTPAGGPVFYEFGDGTWDYAETGGYSHEYATAGTYTIQASRGGATVETEVTVPSAGV